MINVVNRDITKMKKGREEECKRKTERGNREKERNIYKQGDGREYDKRGREEGNDK